MWSCKRATLEGDKMNWKQVELRLERSFTARPRRYGSTDVIEGRKPFRLAIAMNKVLSEEEEVPSHIAASDRLCGRICGRKRPTNTDHS
jgi:hypothetical protein